MIRSALLAVTNRTVTRKLVTETPMGRAIAHRFVAGDSLESAIIVASSLNERGLAVSLDHLGEHVSSVQEAESATEDYLACLSEIESANLTANISVKLTQLGMGFDDDAAARNLDRLAIAAKDVGTTVTVDMEESAYTEATIEIYSDAQRRHGNLGIAIQAYLRRSAADIEHLISLGAHVRLCKGAYVEPDSIAFQSSAEVDGSFDDLASVLMQANGAFPAIASHDDARLAPVLDQAKDRSGAWEFQMLYGVRRDRQQQLVDAGHTMRVYVPYGKAWYPYLTRRLAERPANLLFFGRALTGG